MSKLLSGLYGDLRGRCLAEVGPLAAEVLRRYYHPAT